MFSNIGINFKRKNYRINLRNKDNYKILLIQEKEDDEIKLYFIKPEGLIKIENKSPYNLIEELQEIYDHALINKSLEYLLKCKKEG